MTQDVNWRTFRGCKQEWEYSPGDLVQKKVAVGNENAFSVRTGIVLAVNEDVCAQGSWLKMVKVMWCDTEDIQEVATIYLHRIESDGRS